MKTKLAAFFLLAGTLTASVPMSAHHGNAAYENKSIELKEATVTRFLWSNPHSLLYFDVKDESGKAVNWGAETNSPSILKASGWTKEVVKPGDKITVILHPSKAGTPVGVIQTLTLPNGKALSRGGQAGQ